VSTFEISLKHSPVFYSLVFTFLTLSFSTYVLDNISLLPNENKTTMFNVFRYTISVTLTKPKKRVDECLIWKISFSKQATRLH